MTAPRRQNRMTNANRFKLGLFATNCSGGLCLTKAPERWDPSWANNRKAAQMADAAGLEFLLPIARWKGYGGETDTEGASFETLNWASAILAATENIVAFGTVHVPMIHPIFAAKQIVTADHVGEGRFGLNVVSGGNAPEFRMFGVELLEHDARYVFSEEWLQIAKQVWESDQPFDFKGKFFDLKGVISKPKPWGGSRPLLMSAGSSKAGRAFASRHADCLFMAIIKDDNLASELKSLRAEAGGRDVGVYASGHMVCRATQKEAEEYYHYVVYEMGDWAGAEKLLEVRVNQQSLPVEELKKVKERVVSGTGTFPVIGSADQCAQTFKRLCDAGLDGMALGLVNYIDELPFIQAELLPRMQRLGLRA
jgi:alkanesulfonate monooxygenase SsuD/methylene tetrahydromethanopterin reductase-like flavin-dependent oxidoreductase (luciferase family)